MPTVPRILSLLPEPTTATSSAFCSDQYSSLVADHGSLQSTSAPAASAAAATASRGQQGRQLVIVQGVTLVDRVEHHCLRIVRCIRPPLQTRLAGISRLCEVDPCLRNLILKRHSDRTATGSRLDLRHAERVEAKREFGAMEGRNAAIDWVFPGEQVVVDRRFALLELARQYVLGAAPGSAGVVKNVLDFLAGDACLNSVTT